MSITDAPCKFPSVDIHGVTVLRKPSVDCEGQCDTCGWNPAVHEARMIKIREKMVRGTY